MNSPEVAIIGAGLGGLAATLALQRCGVTVRVYEQAPQLGEVGAGLTLSPNALAALDFLGVGQAMRERATPLHQSSLRHYRTNDPLTENRSRNDADLQYLIHRADAHQVLVDAVREADSEALVLHRQLLSYRSDEQAIESYFADGSSAVSSVLLGCDGAKSVVRTVGFREPPPQFGGFVAFRGLIPVQRLDTAILRPGATLSIGPGRIFMRYRVRHNSLLNYVGIVRTDRWQEEGWNISSTSAEALEQFADWSEEVQSILRATPVGSGFKWALLYRAPLRSWVRGRVALLGDAAHTITPFLGQGAAMALEDAVVLGRCFAAESDRDRALQAYQRARIERGNWMLMESRQQADRLMVSDPAHFDAVASRALYQRIFAYDPAIVPC
jgi:salicylate hydroxylase